MKRKRQKIHRHQNNTQIYIYVSSHHHELWEGITFNPYHSHSFSVFTINNESVVNTQQHNGQCVPESERERKKSEEKLESHFFLNCENKQETVRPEWTQHEMIESSYFTETQIRTCVCICVYKTLHALDCFWINTKKLNDFYSFYREKYPLSSSTYWYW